MHKYLLKEDTFTVFSEDNLVDTNLRFSSVKPSLLEEKYGERFVDQNLTLDRYGEIPCYLDEISN